MAARSSFPICRTINGNEIVSPDLEKGHLEEESILVMHHEAVEAVKEEGHYEVVAVYSNGGKDAAWVVDVPGVEAQEAWDEYEDILRYIPYTDEELAAMEEARNQPTVDELMNILLGVM